MSCNFNDSKIEEIFPLETKDIAIRVTAYIWKINIQKGSMQKKPFVLTLYNIKTLHKLTNSKIIATEK